MRSERKPAVWKCTLCILAFVALPWALSAAGPSPVPTERLEHGRFLRPAVSGSEGAPRIAVAPSSSRGSVDGLGPAWEAANVRPETAAPNPGWAAVLNINDGSLLTYDMSTSPPTMHGPFLAGQLGGAGNGPLTVAPGGRYAVVPGGSNSTLYRVDLSDPTAPVIDACVDLPFLVMQAGISPDGTYALVIGLSPSFGLTNRIAVVDLSSFTLKTVYTLVTPNAQLANVAVAADNTTWVAADISSRIIYGTYSLAGGFAGELTLPAHGEPNDVAISPDGQTVIVPTIFVYTIDVYQITAPGTLVSKGTVATPGGSMWAAFTANGSKAYLYSRSAPLNGDVFSWLSVTGPGTVSMGGSGVAKVFPYSGTIWIGPPPMALSADQSTLLAVQEYQSPTTDTRIGLVNTSTYAVTYVDPGTDYPDGIATFIAAPPCPSIAVSAAPAIFPVGEAGIPYGPIAFSASGGAGPYSFILSCGSSPLPPGITLGTDGTLSGTPTAPGTYPFSVTAIDADGCAGSASFSVTLGSFGLCLFDDGGQVKLCIDTGTGAYRYAILGGRWAGKLFTGTGTYSTAYGVGTFRTKATDPNQIQAYDYFGARAYVRFSNKVQMVALQFYDSNLSDDPPCP